MKLLLASSSRYRRQLLEQLRIPFEHASPDIDETPLEGETPKAYVERLARAKANALSSRYPQHWIIGSDQTCVINDQIVGKSGTRKRAIEQLQACSGRAVTFYTGLALCSPTSEDNAKQPANSTTYSLVEPFTVHFRDLSTEEIARYVDLEHPFDCAGSFKVEGLGIQLFKALDGRDYNSLIGLPLIGLNDLMRQANLSPLMLTPVE